MNDEAEKYLSKNNEFEFNEDDLKKIVELEEIKEDEEFFSKFIMQNDENKKEFLNEAHEKQEESDFLSGWGSWAGDTKAINAKEFLKKKRYQQKQAITNNTGNSTVKVNNHHDKKVINF